MEIEFNFSDAVSVIGTGVSNSLPDAPTAGALGMLTEVVAGILDDGELSTGEQIGIGAVVLTGIELAPYVAASSATVAVAG